MITARAFAGKHYAVLGLARSGLATVEALLASGARVTAWDDKEEARKQLLPGTGRGTSEAGGGVNGTAPIPLHHPADGSPPRAGEDLAIEDFTIGDLTRFDSIVVTPGLPLNRHPIAPAAKAAGVEIIGDIELFARARPELPPHKVVGITGTNGKSTTTALVHHILKTAGVPTTMGGNIGLPILAQDPLTPNENGVGVYVLELSSYQIDLTKSLDCDVAVLLNITPDHLDRYESFETYADAKWRLFEMQSRASHQVICIDDPEIARVWDSWWDRFQDLNPCRPSAVGNEYRQTNWPSLQGPHNLQNARAAESVVSELTVNFGFGISPDLVEEGFRTFTGLAHRMERIRENSGVLFVNDSKATNAEAAAPALAAYPRIRWIVGGQAKTGSLGDTEKHLGHVVKAYAIGEAGPMFARLLRAKGVEVADSGTLDAAVRAAAVEAQDGETVLLSPACASFDQFANFEARGDAFRELVSAL